MLAVKKKIKKKKSLRTTVLRHHHAGVIKGKKDVWLDIIVFP